MINTNFIIGISLISIYWYITTTFASKVTIAACQAHIRKVCKCVITKIGIFTRPSADAENAKKVREDHSLITSIVLLSIASKTFVFERQDFLGDLLCKGAIEGDPSACVLPRANCPIDTFLLKSRLGKMDASPCLLLWDPALALPPVARNSSSLVVTRPPTQEHWHSSDILPSVTMAHKVDPYEGIDFEEINEATDLADDEIKCLKNCFDLFDSKKQTFLSADDLDEILRAMGFRPSAEELKAILEEIDEDGSGEIEFAEFCQLCAKFLVEDPDIETLKRELKAAFRSFFYCSTYISFQQQPYFVESTTRMEKGSSRWTRWEAWSPSYCSRSPRKSWTGSSTSWTRTAPARWISTSSVKWWWAPLRIEHKRKCKRTENKPFQS